MGDMFPLKRYPMKRPIVGRHKRLNRIAGVVLDLVANNASQLEHLRSLIVHLSPEV